LTLFLLPLALLLLHALLHALPRYQLLIFFSWTAAAGVGWGGLLSSSGWYRRWGKRGLDLAVAVPTLVLLMPLFLLLAGSVLVAMGRPIFFRQLRPGLFGRPFSILKLRTMKEVSDEAGEPLPDEARRTWVGDLLRRWSLDELPELFNVLRGDMSLVGPRPLLPEYLPRYTEEQARRHEVRPGITGWAQIHGRNLLSWEERFQRDVWYVDHISLGLDVKILMLTAMKTLTGEGISAQGHATMPPFEGTDGGGGK
jgi:lipopolysaccharide/colanic/teichoic acid biosynthesis glycosyltransferase